MTDQPKKGEKIARKQGSFVVLQQGENGYTVVNDSVAAITGEQAKRTVAQSLTLAEGQAVTLVAVPAKSFKPQTYKVEPQAPRLVAA